jgi:hypothetical protein
MSDYTPKLPEIKFNKNGYEIRTEILSMAKDLVIEDFHAKRHGWELSIQGDEKGVVTTSVAMPQFPGLDKILDAAEQMYTFVTAGIPKK